jgi:sugar phosphate permease
LRKPYYGWIIVGVTFLIGVTESGAFQNILSIFLKPMADEFGWSRAAVSGAMVFGSISAGALSPVVGPVIDRHGPRMVAFFGILILSSGLVCMTFIDRLWQMYLFFGIGRMVAMGVLSLVVPVAVSNWFVRRRGRAMGVVWLGPRVGTAILPAVTQFFILSQGWRMAWTTLGIIVFLLSGIPSLLFLRRRPEDLGLRPDGDPPEPKADTLSAPGGPTGAWAAAPEPDPVWRRSRVMRLKVFWALTLAESLYLFIQAGVNFHIFPYLTDQGLAPRLAVLVLSTIAISGAVGSIVWGALAEKARPKILLGVNGLLSGGIFVLLYGVVQHGMGSLAGIGLVFSLAALYGFLHGGRFPVLSVTWAKFFGRRSLGSIYGFTSPLRFTANAIGPIFGALCFDFFGSYALPFATFTLLFLLAGAIGFFLEPPPNPPLTGTATIPK